MKGMDENQVFAKYSCKILLGQQREGMKIHSKKGVCIPNAPVTVYVWWLRFENTEKLPFNNINNIYTPLPPFT